MSVTGQKMSVFIKIHNIRKGIGAQEKIQLARYKIRRTGSMRQFLNMSAIRGKKGGENCHGWRTAAFGLGAKVECNYAYNILIVIINSTK